MKLNIKGMLEKHTFLNSSCTNNIEELIFLLKIKDNDLINGAYSGFFSHAQVKLNNQINNEDNDHVIVNISITEIFNHNTLKSNTFFHFSFLLLNQKSTPNTRANNLDAVKDSVDMFFNDLKFDKDINFNFDKEDYNVNNFRRLETVSCSIPHIGYNIRDFAIKSITSHFKNEDLDV